MGTIPEVPGVFSQGRTRDGARTNVTDALRLDPKDVLPQCRCGVLHGWRAQRSTIRRYAATMAGGESLVTSDAESTSVAFPLVVGPVVSCAALWVFAFTVEAVVAVQVMTALAVAAPASGAFLVARDRPMRARVTHAAVAACVSVAVIVVTGFLFVLSLGEIGPSNAR